MRVKELAENFSQKQMDFMLNWPETLKNETQIDAFAWMSAYSVFLPFLSPCEMDQFPGQKVSTKTHTQIHLNIVIYCS